MFCDAKNPKKLSKTSLNLSKVSKTKGSFQNFKIATKTNEYQGPFGKEKKSKKIAKISPKGLLMKFIHI